MPILRADMSVDLRRSVVGSDDFDDNVLEILFVMLIAKLRESAFGEKFAGLDDADGVAELFDFGHDVRGENDGFAVVAAFVDESSDGARGHDIKTVGGLVEDHDGDRKSTRLNSSHSQISYAVFCLKKKKQESTIHSMRDSV